MNKESTAYKAQNQYIYIIYRNLHLDEDVDFFDPSVHLFRLKNKKKTRLIYVTQSFRDYINATSNQFRYKTNNRTNSLFKTETTNVVINN